MTDKSVQELAVKVGLPVEKLLDQVREAGLPQKNADDSISNEQQDRLMAHLTRGQSQPGGNAGKITLKRKTTSTAKVASTSGKAKTINVEVRKKHTFTKPDPEQIKAEARAKADADAKFFADQKSQVASAAPAENKASATLDAMRAAQKKETAHKVSQKAEVVVKRRSTN